MNWDMIGAVAETLGAIGVMGTLVFLALETRKGTTATRQQNHHSIVTRRGDIFDSWGKDNETSSIIARGWVGDDIEPIESLRFVWLMMNIMSHYQDIYMQYRAGTLEREVWVAEQRVLGAMTPQPGFQSWWNEASQYFSTEFVDVVKTIEPMDLVVFDRESKKWTRPGGVYEP